LFSCHACPVPTRSNARTVCTVSSRHHDCSNDRQRGEPLGPVDFHDALDLPHEIANTLEPSDWKRLSAGEGTKGPRLHDWCYLELADLDADEYNEANHGLWTRGLLLRQNIEDGELAYFTTWCPAGTAIETLVTVEGHRWSIEDSFETAKNEFGLDHNETRSWHGWHRHVSLVMMAFAMMAAIRHQANQATPKKTKIPIRKNRARSSAGRSRKSAE